MNTTNCGKKPIFPPILVYLLLSLCLSDSTAADGAGLFISANELIFDRNTRSHSLHITNRGNRTGVYTMSWIDHTMTEEGRLLAWKEPSQSPWSLQPYIRFSPRRVTLRPGESQRIRIALKSNRSEFEGGELFSHLRVLTLNNNLEATTSPNKNTAEVSPGIEIKTRSAINIPVVWRKTSAQPKATITLNSRTNMSLTLNIRRIGQVSNRGFLHVMHRFGGVSKALTNTSPFVIYANIENRTTTLNFDAALPQQGSLDIYYSSSKDDLDQLLGQTNLKL